MMKTFINRREFLKQSSLALAALSVSPLQPLAAGPQKLERKGPAQKVIVLGAGLAGLVATYELTQAGHDVTVLEARLRPGGRVHTLREPFADGLYAEAGAARIPDVHTLTLEYAKLFDLPLDPFYPSELAFTSYVRGKRLHAKAGESPEWPLALTPEEQKLGIPGMFGKYVMPVMKEIGNPREPGWPPASLKKYDQMTPVEFFRHQGASPEAASLLMLGNDFENVSVLYVLRMLALDQNARVLYKIRGGNDRLPKAFAARLAEKIRYGAPVTRIERSEKGVRVVFQQGGGHQAIAGDRLICTIPFPVLRNLEISPPFSPDKQRAIAQVPYLSVTRVFVQSKKRFWVDQGLNGFGRTDHPMEIWHPSFDQQGPRGIFLSYMTGKLARRVGAMKEAERLSFAIEELEKVFPGTREHAEGGVSKSWDEDQWVRGAAAEFEPGQMSTLLPHIARAEGRVHFAGEHTSPWAAWMQGALESGVRAAREVNDAP